MEITIQNTQECFVALWRQLERTRQLFGMQYKRFCIRRVLQSWYGSEATDDFIWEVCLQATCHEEEEPVYGLDELPLPSLYPTKSRDFLRALVAVKLKVRKTQINLKAVDAAYSIVYPHSTPINVDKKKRKPP